MPARLFTVETERQRAMLAAFITRQPIPFQASVGPLRKQRTLSQNARYWKIVQMAADVIGCSAADLHADLLCEHYGYSEVKLPSGVIRRVPVKRSSTRDTKEFNVLMDWAEIYLGERLGVWLDQAA